MARTTWRGVRDGVRDVVVGGAQIAATLVAAPVLRSRYNRWGATPLEVAAAMPGDGVVPDPRLGYTRAVEVDAPPAAVWPWLVQIGHGRGGLYSFDALENLARCDLHSAATVMPEHQHLVPGATSCASGPRATRASGCTWCGRRPRWCW